MLAPKVTFSCKGYFFSQIVILNARLGSPLVLRLCALGSSRALIYDELYIELNDVKWQTLLDRIKYIINIKNNSIDGILQ